MKHFLFFFILVNHFSSFAKIYQCESKTESKQIVTLDFDKTRLNQIVTFQKFNIYGEPLTTTTYFDVSLQTNLDEFKTFRIDREGLMISIELVLDPEKQGPRLRYVERIEVNGEYTYNTPQGYFPCHIK